MKNIILKAIAISICIFYTAITFSQNVTIDYQAWNPPSPPCDIFNSATNVPASINGATSTIEHQTLIGDARYNTSDQSVQLDNNYGSASNIRGTKYRIAYNFKVGYRYIITVTAAELYNTAGTSFGPYLRLDLTNAGGGGGTACVGPTTINQNLAGNPPAYQYSSTTFLDRQFPFSTALSAAFTTLEVSSIPAPNGGSNSLRIRKITIAETAPAANFTLSPTAVSVACGSSTTQTFTVTNDNNTQGVTSYEWNLGSANNGWLYNGIAAPQNISTTTNTLTLTSATCGTVLNNVSVTVRINNADYQSLIATASITMPSYSITGPSIICTPETYTLNGNLPCNATVLWQATPSGIVTINSPNSTQTVVTKYTAGDVTLSATITGCSSASEYQSIHAGGYSSGDYPVSGPDNTTCNSYVTYRTNQLAGATNYAWFYPSDWTYIDGLGTYTITLRTPSTATSDNYTVGVRVANSCDAGGSYAIKNTFLSSCDGVINSYSISPNPATSDVTVSSVAANKQTPQKTITAVNIYNQQGNLKKQQAFNKVKKAIINVSNLPTGIYFIEIVDGQHKERQQLSVVR